MRKRTTFSVARLLWSTNYFLEHSKPEQNSDRLAVASLTEGVLHATGNYEGFGYLEFILDPIGGFVLGNQTRTRFYVSEAISAEYCEIERKHQEENR